MERLKVFLAVPCESRYNPAVKSERRLAGIPLFGMPRRRENNTLKEREMPKMKTHSSAKKRFKVTRKGKVKAKQAFARHMMRNKPKKMKRQAKGTTVLCDADATIILRNYLPYARKKKSKATSNKKETA